MTATVELAAGPARVVIAPSVGGSIASFEYDGMPVLRPTPPDELGARAVRNFACFPLIPFSNRIADATLHWAGREYHLKRYIDDMRHAIHGNGWQRRWRVSNREGSSLSIELNHDAMGARAREWPFPYRARQRFDLLGDASAARVDLALEIENTGVSAFPFGLGWHPYFHRDLQTELGFTARGVWHTDPSRLPTRLTATPPECSFDPPRRIGDTTLDNCYAGWRPPAIVRWPARKLVARIAADDACEYLIVYIPSDPAAPAPFFALEPVTHMTDAFNRDGKGDDTGTRVLAPGARFSCTMSISVSRNA